MLFFLHLWKNKLHVCTAGIYGYAYCDSEVRSYLLSVTVWLTFTFEFIIIATWQQIIIISPEF